MLSGELHLAVPSKPAEHNSLQLKVEDGLFLLRQRAAFELYVLREDCQVGVVWRLVRALVVANTSSLEELMDACAGHGVTELRASVPYKGLPPGGPGVIKNGQPILLRVACLLEMGVHP